MPRVNHASRLGIEKSGRSADLTLRPHVGFGWPSLDRMPREAPERCPCCRCELVVDGDCRFCPQGVIAHYVWATIPSPSLMERLALQGAQPPAISSDPREMDSL